MAFGLIISPFWTVFVAEQQYIFLDLDGKLRTKTTAQVKALKFYPAKQIFFDSSKILKSFFFLVIYPI